MVDAKVAKRYARALFLTCEEKKRLDPVSQDLIALGQCITDSEDLQLFIRNPIFNKEERGQLVRNVFEKDIQPEVLTFLLFLIDKNRLNLIGDIIDIFHQMYLLHENIQEVHLTSEREMDAGLLQGLLNKLSAKSGKKIQSHLMTDTDLLGGFKLRMGDVVYDASLKTQLRRFQESIISTV